MLLDTSSFSRFCSKVVIPEDIEDCWSWSGTVLSTGYGQFVVAGKRWLAHRLSLGLTEELIADRVCDHACGNKNCVNPLHLRQVTAKTNAIENSSSPTAKNAAKTVCLNGHPLHGANVYRPPGGGRLCRACARKRQATYESHNRRRCSEYEKQRRRRLMVSRDGQRAITRAERLARGGKR